MTAELAYLKDLPPVGEARMHELPGGGELAWDEYGDPDGEVVVFYHGWPSSRLQARMSHHLASERGLRVIAVDRPGMGRSSFVANRQLGGLAPMIEHLLDSLGVGCFGQLGVSGGGPYVLAGEQYFGARVSGSVVLCGAVPLAGGARVGLHPLYRVLIPVRRLPAVVFAPALAFGRACAQGDVARAPFRWLLRSLPAADREVLLANPGAMPVFAASFREGVRQGPRGVLTDGGIYFHDWGIDLAAERAPIHYWHGGQDGNIPVALVREFVGQVRGATLEVDACDGHFSLALRRAPAAMDFLREQVFG